MDHERLPSDRTPDDAPQRADELFHSWLVAGVDGAAGAAGEERFEALCREHPDEASELRRLQHDWLLLQRTRSRIEILERVTTPALRDWVERWMRAQNFRERYALVRALGEGGQAQVKEAIDRTLSRPVAVKTLRLPSTELAARTVQEAQLARFLAEAQITAQLDHPGVVAVHELSIDEFGQPYFTMTRVRGEDLRQVLTRCRAGDGSWPMVRVLSVLLRVSETVRFAHARGVVHRDLKPANVMVGAFGEVFVMDWGLAHVSRGARADAISGGDAPDSQGANERIQTLRRASGADDVLATATHENLGTVFYMAPESALNGPADPTAAVDVYALGAILYELLAGAPPYFGEGAARTQLQVLEDVRRGPPAPLAERAPHAPAELVSIAQRALARDPRERYPGLDAFAEDLRSFLEGRVVRAHEVGAWAELRKWVARNRKLAAALALTLASILAGLVAVARVEARAREELDLQADLYRLPYLEREAARLWPEQPERIAALEAWMASAERLVGRLPLHARELEALRLRARGADDRFDRAADRAQFETLGAMVEALEQLAHPQHGLVANVRRRLEWARNVERVTLSEPRADWDAACERVARRDGPYRGAELTRTLGLIPLGPDPASGLEEFAFARSGAIPARDPATRALNLDERSAIVFVLLPAGEFLMGAQAQDVNAPGHDPLARSEEGPVRTERVDSFWIAKHELTRGQWTRLGGVLADASTADFEGGEPERHPIVSVSWSACAELLTRFRLSLPTEGQWEYAARGGASGGYLGHDSPRALAGAVNLADSTVIAAKLGWPQAAGMEWLADGFVRHAPVGTFAPNRFGLHDVLGNVWEWCSDDRRLDAAAREATDSGACVARGGGFINNIAFARTTIRDTGRSRSFDSAYHGVRPVMLPRPAGRGL